MTSESDLVLLQSLRDEHNLRIAVKVGLVFQDLKNKVWRDFLRHLEARVQEALGGDWKTEVNFQDELSPCLRKDSWPPDKWFGLGSDHASTGKHCYYWVPHFGDVLGNVFIDQELKSALYREVGKGRTDSGIAWLMMLDQWRDWDSEEAIIE